MTESTTFVFIACQNGAEVALKQEVAREQPNLRLAFSRPGFLTFKLLRSTPLPQGWSEQLVFARAAGFCLGKTQAATPTERAAEVWNLVGDLPVTDLHVWPRDQYTPGFRDYEPGPTPESEEARKVIEAQRPATRGGDLSKLDGGAAGKIANIPGFPTMTLGGALIADVVLVSPTEWWIGCHQPQADFAKRPGGFSSATLPPNVVSRAWLKMNEAVEWSGFDLKAGETCVEIGSAPGGASQYLLSRGLKVMGVDPAVMDPVVMADQKFRHIRKRSKEVPRAEFVGVEWLTCDVNLPPNYTLDTVKAIVTHRGVKFKGMLLTLKLVEWSLAEEIPKFLAKVRAMGFRRVVARQLHHNRQEICVAASDYREKSIEPAPKKEKAPDERPPGRTFHRPKSGGPPTRGSKPRKSAGPARSAKPARPAKPGRVAKPARSPKPVDRSRKPPRRGKR